MDYVQNEERVDVGEWFYTSGDDRIFPKGFPVGQVAAVHNGKTFKEIYVTPSGMQGGAEEVLIVLARSPPGNAGWGSWPRRAIRILPRRPTLPPKLPQGAPQPGASATDADRLRAIYKQAGEEQKHVFGEGAPDRSRPISRKSLPLHGPRPAAGPHRLPRHRLPRSTSRTRPALPKPKPPTGPPAAAGRCARQVDRTVPTPMRSRSRASASARAANPASSNVPVATNDRVHRAPVREAPRKETASRFRLVWLVAIPLMAILSQVYVPRFIPFLSYLELPLLITVHFALDQPGPDSGPVLRDGHRFGAGLLVESADRHVRDRQDAGGILRRLRQHAVRC